MDGIAYEVIGILPSDFTFLDRKPAFLLPLQLDRNKTILGNVSYEGIARLKPGVTIEQAVATSPVSFPSRYTAILRSPDLP